MRCPHGEELEVRNICGVRLFVHKDGGGCRLLNDLRVNCERLAAANMKRAAKCADWDDHMLRTAYSSYKISRDARFFYLSALCGLGRDKFEKGFAPVRMALVSEDDFAARGLYLMELYFCFCGISSRITAVNEEVSSSELYIFLKDMNVTRVIPHEDEITRAYSRLLSSEYPSHRNVLKIP
ncbi:MAG: hypothetical protein LBL05_04530, partial [Synergistaceae bacterium]|nr:hypothetical protein [Synergistaceae bacterium]